MSIKPRTIDNLGIEASNDYAKRQQDLDLRLVEDKFLPTKIEPVIAPYISAETMERILIGPITSWAILTPPKNFDVISSRLFTFQPMPSISLEKLQANSDHLDEIKTDQQSCNTCKNLVKSLIELYRTHELIKARCNQYQRG